MLTEIFNFFSELIVNLTLVLGIIGIVISWLVIFIPFLIPYKIPINIISTILVVIGIFFKGVYYQKEKWNAEIADLTRRVQIAEAKSAEVNTQIETQVNKEIKQTKEVVNEIKKDIIKHKADIDTCKLPDAARMLYNRAVSGQVPRRSAESINPGPVTKALRPE